MRLSLRGVPPPAACGHAAPPPLPGALGSRSGVPFQQPWLTPPVTALSRAPRNKREFFSRWLRLEFGNRPRAYGSVAELVRDADFHGTLSVRQLQASANVLYRVPADDVRAGRVLVPYECVLQETMPDDRLVIQGAVRRAVRGLDLDFSLEPNVTLRDALEQRGARTARKFGSP